MVIDPASGQVSTVAGTNDPLLPSCASGRWTTSMEASDYSFGRAMPSGDYKVHHLHESGCEVATVIMDGGAAEPTTWRRRPWGPFRFYSPFLGEHKATVNGVLYFMPYGARIAAFDLESEEWKAEMIKGPILGRKKGTEKWSIALAELKGTLCLVHNVQHFTSWGGYYANIWLLEDPKSIWVNEYTIQKPESLLLFTMPLEVLGDDGTILLLLNAFWKAGNVERHHRYILQFYNSRTTAFTDLMEMAEGFNGRMAFYTGSLLLS